MKENNFIFCDLSTYDFDVAKDFYSKIFGWTYHDAGNGYSVAHLSDDEISGLYETPQKFKEMKMPSFWMSYIQVNNLQETVSKARELGGIIELVDENSPIGQIALIRDPLGAGFTVYEGDQLNARYTSKRNALVWNELFVSDMNAAVPFYQGIFNWKINSNKDGRSMIMNGKNETIGAIQQSSDATKGKYEYWGIFFLVDNRERVKKEALSQGGSLIYEDDEFTALADPFGAFFHILDKLPLMERQSSFTPSSQSKWKAYLGILLILLSFFTGWYWIWGIFFAIWVYSDLRSGYTHLFESISKESHPILYWVVVSLWALIGIYSVWYYLSL